MKQRRGGPLSPEAEKVFREKELQIHAELRALRGGPSPRALPTKADPLAELILEIQVFLKTTPTDSEYAWLDREREYSQYIARLRSAKDPRAEWLEDEFLREKLAMKSERSANPWEMARLAGLMVAGIVGAVVLCGRIVLRRFKRKRSDGAPMYLLG
jgi:hypothetical protein